eukprot:996887-Rhodomonas_salina.1
MRELPLPLFPPLRGYIFSPALFEAVAQRTEPDPRPHLERVHCHDGPGGLPAGIVHSGQPLHCCACPSPMPLLSTPSESFRPSEPGIGSGATTVKLS